MLIYLTLNSLKHTNENGLELIRFVVIFGKITILQKRWNLQVERTTEIIKSESG